MKRIVMVMVSILLLLSLAFPTLSSAAINQNELNEYLNEIGLTQEELEDQLEYHWGMELSDFESVDELRDFLGPVITDENLQELLDLYELTLGELEEILAEYGETLDDYKFLEGLELAIIFYQDFDDFDWDELFAEIDALFAEFDLTDEEIERLMDHLLTLDLDNPAFEERLNQIAERALALPDFDSASDLTAEEIAEILSIYSDLMNLFKLHAEYYLIEGRDKDSKQPISLQTLVTLDSLEGYNLLIELYNLEGAFLADIIITADMFGDELIKQPAQDLKEVKEIVKKAPPKDQVKTEKGAKMPKTASNSMQNALIGLGMMLTAGIIYRRLKVKEA
ncbi:processed acidic surface protein [Alkalihalobacterium sp. APHAB7]|uniref:processed acidic surface protein n=1 Tax=Alkalihalobacterium sp. APHAB7 TaxID=3402081 RepID=UPI003AAF2963